MWERDHLQKRWTVLDPVQNHVGCHICWGGFRHCTIYHDPLTVPGKEGLDLIYESPSNHNVIKLLDQMLMGNKIRSLSEFNITTLTPWFLSAGSSSSDDRSYVAQDLLGKKSCWAPFRCLVSVGCCTSLSQTATPNTLHRMEVRLTGWKLGGSCLLPLFKIRTT